jgi:plastocyanin domain-containing protein
LTPYNNAIVVPQYGLEIKLQQGEQTIEFTPPESGVVPWSCWMGMIPGAFIVVDQTATTAEAGRGKVTGNYESVRQKMASVWHEVKQMLAADGQNQ